MATCPIKGEPAPSRLDWISVAPGVPYFRTEGGKPWHPVGQNDAISWPELNPLFRQKNPAAAHAYLEMLAAHGVTCMRLMLEYAQHRHRFFETTAGNWAPNMVRLWDDLFLLCEQYGIRILLTPYDTFWMWLKFKHHPYNSNKGGPLRHPSRALLSRGTRDAIKARLTFAAERWGGSGALFAWDLWNEIHPAQAEGRADPFADFIQDLSQHVRTVETHKFGRSHLQTVSLFGPELTDHPHLQMEAPLFRHPSLDFATIHIYEQGTIDDPSNTVDAAIGMGNIVGQCLREIEDRRPFLDSEHGPIHRFKDHRVTLPASFDDEYFRHMQWAHLASGGAGGGMRWPNRNPHSLTPGMRAAQRNMSCFLPQVDWLRFDSANVSKQLQISDLHGEPISENTIARFACCSTDQAVIYLLRRDNLLPNGQLDPYAAPLKLSITLAPLENAQAKLTLWDTVQGKVATLRREANANSLLTGLQLVTDLVISVKMTQ